MATLPTAEDAAKHILATFAQHNSRPGEVLQLGILYQSFLSAPWRASDLIEGITFAIQQGWIEQMPSGDAYRLTDAGFAAT
jgi:hypothetical protein